MKVLLVKDGTIPVGVCEVLYEDGLENIAERFEGEVEVFEATEDEALWVSWVDGEGFTVDSCSFASGLHELLHGPDERGEVTEVSPGHLAVTVDPGEDEWYAHLFDMRRFR